MWFPKATKKGTELSSSNINSLLPTVFITKMHNHFTISHLFTETIETDSRAQPTLKSQIFSFTQLAKFQNKGSTQEIFLKGPWQHHRTIDVYSNRQFLQRAIGYPKNRMYAALALSTNSQLKRRVLDNPDHRF